MWKVIKERVKIAKHFFYDVTFTVAMYRGFAERELQNFQDVLNTFEADVNNEADLDAKFRQIEALTYYNANLDWKERIQRLFAELEADAAARLNFYKSSIAQVGNAEIEMYLGSTEAKMLGSMDSATAEERAMMYSNVYFILLSRDYEDDAIGADVEVKAFVVRELKKLVQPVVNPGDYIWNTTFVLFRQVRRLSITKEPFLMFIFFVREHQRVVANIGTDIITVEDALSFGCTHPNICKFLRLQTLEKYRELANEFKAEMIPANLQIPYFNALLDQIPVDVAALDAMSLLDCKDLWITLVFLQGLAVNFAASGLPVVTKNAVPFQTRFEMGLYYATLCMHWMDIPVTWPNDALGSKVKSTYFPSLANLLKAKELFKDVLYRGSHVASKSAPFSKGTVNRRQSQFIASTFQKFTKPEFLPPQYQVDKYIDGIQLPKGNTRKLIEKYENGFKFAKEAKPNTIVPTAFVVKTIVEMIDNMHAVTSGVKAPTIATVFTQYESLFKNQEIYCRILLELLRKFCKSPYCSLDEQFRRTDLAYTFFILRMHLYDRLEKANEEIKDQFARQKIDYSGVITTAFYCDHFYPGFHEFLLKTSFPYTGIQPIP